MEKIATQTLIDQLQADTRQLLVNTKHLQQLPAATLLQQPAPDKWSAAQAVEHLNTYGRYYLPALEKAISTGKLPANAWFRSGWLGAYFTRSMKPQPDGTIPNKMKAFKHYVPVPDLNAQAVLAEFEQQQLKLLELLTRGLQVDLNQKSIPVSIAPFIKLKIGDAFNFLIAHEQRHFLQAERVLKSIGNGQENTVKCETIKVKS
jgi:hypothetical protein